MTSDALELAKESGVGKCFNTGDHLIQVFKLSGTWFEMGQQYGAFAKDGVQQVWNVTVQPYIDRDWISEADALNLFGRRVFESSSHRMKELHRGVADALEWCTLDFSVETSFLCGMLEHHGLE